MGKSRLNALPQTSTHIRHVKFKAYLNFAKTQTGIGSPDKTRTCDLMINSHPLYRLSYRGIEAES